MFLFISDYFFFPLSRHGESTLNQCDQHHHCEADAHIPVKLKSSEIDLCCIIGNLFDNAIEASMKLPQEQRQIRVYMDMKNTQL